MVSVLLPGGITGLLLKLAVLGAGLAAGAQGHRIVEGLHPDPRPRRIVALLPAQMSWLLGVTVRLKSLCYRRRSGKAMMRVLHCEAGLYSPVNQKGPIIDRVHAHGGVVARSGCRHCWPSR